MKGEQAGREEGSGREGQASGRRSGVGHKFEVSAQPARASRRDTKHKAFARPLKPPPTSFSSLRRRCERESPTCRVRRPQNSTMREGAEWFPWVAADSSSESQRNVGYGAEEGELRERRLESRDALRGSRLRESRIVRQQFRLDGRVEGQSEESRREEQEGEEEEVGGGGTDEVEVAARPPERLSSKPQSVSYSPSSARSSRKPTRTSITRSCRFRRVGSVVCWNVGTPSCVRY